MINVETGANSKSEQVEKELSSHPLNLFREEGSESFNGADFQSCSLALGYRATICSRAQSDIPQVGHAGVLHIHGKEKVTGSYYVRWKGKLLHCPECWRKHEIK